MTIERNMNEGKTAIQTTGENVSTWLEHCFSGVSDAPDFKKLSASIWNEQFLLMAINDLSDETIDCAARVYYDKWDVIKRQQQAKLRENGRDWIEALLVAGAISIASQQHN